MTFHSQICSWSDYREACIRDGAGFQKVFRQLVESDIQAGGIADLLDIGCGDSIPTPLRLLRERVRNWDGVEPSPSVALHPDLRNRWHSTLEEASIADAKYPFAIAYNVVEHVARPADFLKSVYRILEPEGVFWALTPHAHHPFARLSRSIEVIGLKRLMALGIDRRAGRHVVNDYPAYYRMNSPRTIDAIVHRIGFREAKYYFFPSPQWASYFPNWLRWIPNSYDSILGNRFPTRALLMAMRLVK